MLHRQNPIRFYTQESIRVLVSEGSPGKEINPTERRLGEAQGGYMGAAAVTGCVWLLCRGVWLCQGVDVAAVAGKRCLELLPQHCAWC